MPRYVRDRQAIGRALELQDSVLVDGAVRPWSAPGVINYVRAGRSVPRVTPHNAQRYLTWLHEVTLNGVVLRDHLHRHGFSSELIQTFGYETDARIDEFLERGPRCVVVSTTFITLDVILALKEVRDRVRQVSPRIPVVAGSSVLRWYLANYPELVATVLDCCDIVIDEAQDLGTLCRLVEALRCGTPLDSVPNLIFRRRGKVCRTPREPENIAMRDFAPDWERWLPRGYSGRVAVQTSQGCPFTCKFCDFRLMNRTDYKPLDVLREELRALHAIGVRKIDFVDDLFTLPEERLVEVCRMILDEGWDSSWFCLSRSSGLSVDAIGLMTEAGCTMVNVGMESADPEVLANMSKNTRVDEARRQVEAFVRHGVTVFTNIILGYPGETDESIGRTIRFLNETGVHAYLLNLFQVGRGTIVDAPEYRERFALVGENDLWSHRTGTSLEFAGKMGEFAAQVSGTVLRLGGLEDMQMLMNGGYTRPQLASLAPLVQGLAECARTAGVPAARATQRSGDLLEQVARLERARGSLPEAPPNRSRAGTAQAATGR